MSARLRRPGRLRYGRMFGRTLAGSVAALAMIATVGCGTEPETNIEQADDEPKRSEPEKKPEPSPSASPKMEDEPYVRAALDYYEARNEALETGDADPMRALSTDDCETCQKSADSLEAIFENGGRNEGGEATPDPDTPITANVTQNGEGADVIVVYKYASQVIVRESGAEPERYSAERMTKHFVMTREGNEWLIDDIITD